MPPVRSVLTCALVSLAAVACAARPSEPVEPQATAKPEVVEPDVVADACGERSLAAAIDEGRAALEAGVGEGGARLGLAIEQALACEVGARAWDLELEAVALLEALDPILDPGAQRCRINSEGVCVYAKKKKKHREPEREARQPYAAPERLRLEAYARYEAAAAPGEALRVIRERHIRLRLEHRDFVAALALLQDYVVDYHDHEGAVAMAIAMVDTFVNVSTVARDRPAYVATSALAWFDRLATLALWRDPKAAELHGLIVELRPGLMWAAAMESRDEGRNQLGVERPGFRHCAELFMDIYNSYPDHDRVDTLLWNAAECFEANYDFGRAYATRVALLERYPESRHHRYTLRFLAEQDHAIARYDRARALYLEYARLYPKADDGVDALVWAYRFAAALGHDASELVAEYVRREKKRDVRRTGNFLWATRPRVSQELLGFALEFERQFGRKAGTASYDAMRVIAELSWAQACRARLDDDLCIARAPARETCPLAGEPLPSFRARDRALAEDARSRLHFGPKRTRELEREAYYEEARWAAEIVAGVAFFAVEPELEDWLVAGPDAPDARERAPPLAARSLEVAELGQLDFAIRAHARCGLIWEVLATPGLRSHGGVCLPVTNRAEGDRKRALAGYAQCLAIAVEHQHVTEAAHRCEAKLAAVDPELTPPLVELFGEPGLLPSEPEGVGVVAR